jgi:hypothetical protein
VVLVRQQLVVPWLEDEVTIFHKLPDVVSVVPLEVVQQ